MYDPVSRTVIDQYHHSSNHVFNTEDIIPPLGALNETAYFAGREYIERFLPSYYTVRRDLYKRAKGPNKHKFKTAFRYAEVANWEGAIEKWEELSDDEKRKTAGRACLNIAVAYEVLGDTDKALEWAKKAYEDYNDKLGRDYAKILLRRQRIEN
jgi:tetratricopeptide (TPR) repeat protein